MCIRSRTTTVLRAISPPVRSVIGTPQRVPDTPVPSVDKVRPPVRDRIRQSPRVATQVHRSDRGRIRRAGRRMADGRSRRPPPAGVTHPPKTGGVVGVGAWAVGRVVESARADERCHPESPPFHGSPPLRAGCVRGSGVGTSFPAALPSQIRTHESHSGHRWTRPSSSPWTRRKSDGTCELHDKQADAARSEGMSRIIGRPHTLCFSQDGKGCQQDR